MKFPVLYNKRAESLQALWEEAKNGNHKALEKIYHMIYPTMMNLCLRYAGNLKDAEDIFTEAFIKLTEKMHIITYNSEEYLGNYIRKIFVNHAIDFLRTKKKCSVVHLQEMAENLNKLHKQHKEEDEIIFDEKSDEDTSNEDELLYSSSVSPDSLLDDLKRIIPAEAIITAIQSLTPAYRTVLNMHLIDGYSHSEIAKELGISESTSKTNFLRAKKALYKILLTKYPIISKVFKINDEEIEKNK